MLPRSVTPMSIVCETWSSPSHIVTPERHRTVTLTTPVTMAGSRDAGNGGFTRFPLDGFHTRRQRPTTVSNNTKTVTSPRPPTCFPHGVKVDATVVCTRLRLIGKRGVSPPAGRVVITAAYTSREKSSRVISTSPVTGLGTVSSLVK